MDIADILTHDALCTWRAQTQSQKDTWKQDIIWNTKIRFSRLQHTLRYWRAWRIEQSHGKKTKEYQHLMAATQIISLKRSLRHWRKCTKSIYVAQKMYIKACAYRSNQQQRQCIQSWHSITRIRKTALRHYQSLVHYKAECVVRCAFDLWRKEHHYRQSVQRASMILHQYFIREQMAQTFHSWKTECFRRQQVHSMAIVFYHHKLKQLIFGRFQCHLHVQRDRTQQLQHVIDAQSTPSEHQVKARFLPWKHDAQKTTNIKRKMDAEIKKQVLLSWHRMNIEKQKRDYYGHKLSRQHEHASMAQIFGDWKVLVVGNQQSESYLLSTHLHFWFEQSQKHNGERIKYEMLRQWLRLKRRNSVWLQWYLLTQDLLEVREKTQIALDFYAHNLQTALFAQWKRYLVSAKQRKRASKSIKYALQRRLKRRAFEHWCALFRVCEHNRHVHETVVHFTLRRSLTYWRERRTWRRYQRFNAFKARLFHLRSYLNAWSSVYEPLDIGNQYEQRLRLSIQPYVDRRNERLKFNVLRAWFIAREMRLQCKKMQKKIAHAFKKKRTRCRKQCVLEAWRKLREDRHMIYCWNESIVVGVIDDVTDACSDAMVLTCTEEKEEEQDIALAADVDDEYKTDAVFPDIEHDIGMDGNLTCSVQERLNGIESSLQTLLSEKQTFQHHCETFLKLQAQNQSDAALNRQIKTYLYQQSQRRHHVVGILRCISSVYQHIASHAQPMTNLT